MSQLLTPFVLENSRLRAHLLISADDMDLFNALPKGDSDESVDVFDEMSQAIYRIRRASCGAGACYCAAEIIEQLTGTFGMESLPTNDARKG